MGSSFYKWTLSTILLLNTRLCSLITLDIFRGEPHIDFRTQCVLMTLRGRDGGAMATDVLKFRKIIEFQSS